MVDEVFDSVWFSKVKFDETIGEYYDSYFEVRKEIIYKIEYKCEEDTDITDIIDGVFVRKLNNVNILYRSNNMFDIDTAISLLDIK